MIVTDIAHALMLPDGRVCWTSKLGWLSHELHIEWLNYKINRIYNANGYRKLNGEWMIVIPNSYQYHPNRMNLIDEELKDIFTRK